MGRGRWIWDAGTGDTLRYTGSSLNVLSGLSLSEKTGRLMYLERTSFNPVLPAHIHVTDISKWVKKK